MKRLLILLAALAAVGAPSILHAQDDGACPMPYTVVPGDSLSNVAERFLGGSQAFLQIVDTTNGLASTDPTFSKIGDPNLIVSGARLCVPNAANAPAGLALSDLANSTFRSEFGENGAATLKNGIYSVEAAPGSASRNVVEVFWVAYGEMNGADAAAVVTWSSGGGSGTFYDLHLVQIQNGKPYDVAAMPLGDRILVQSVKIATGKVTVSYLDRRPDEPMAAAPTVPVTKTLALKLGELVESQPTTVSSLAGTYYARLPAADASGRIVMLVLAPDGRALLATQFIGKGGPILEEGTGDRTATRLMSK